MRPNFPAHKFIQEFERLNGRKPRRSDFSSAEEFKQFKITRDQEIKSAEMVPVIGNGVVPLW